MVSPTHQANASGRVRSVPTFQQLGVEEEPSSRAGIDFVQERSGELAKASFDEADAKEAIEAVDEEPAACEEMEGFGADLMEETCPIDVEQSVLPQMGDTASEPEPEPEPEPTTFDSSSYFAKATSLRDKGLFAVAAKLYAECAELTNDRAVYRKAMIEQIACYVKANQLEQAVCLATEFRNSASDLTAIESLKIDAVLRMAER